MKNLTVISLFILTFCATGFSQKKRLLQEGTIVKIKMNENLDSRVSKVGDMVSMEVSEDVVVDGVVVIKKGSSATGRITVAEPAKWAGQKGKLDFEIDYVKGIKDRNIKLRASSSNNGQSRMGGVIAAAAIINPLFLLMKGKDITIAKDQIFSSYVDKDYEM